MIPEVSSTSKNANAFLLLCKPARVREKGQSCMAVCVSNHNGDNRQTAAEMRFGKAKKDVPFSNIFAWIMA